MLAVCIWGGGSGWGSGGRGGGGTLLLTSGVVRHTQSGHQVLEGLGVLTDHARVESDQATNFLQESLRRLQSVNKSTTMFILIVAIIHVPVTPQIQLVRPEQWQATV
jgi:hypothetical protein